MVNNFPMVVSLHLQFTCIRSTILHGKEQLLILGSSGTCKKKPISINKLGKPEKEEKNVQIE